MPARLSRSKDTEIPRYQDTSQACRASHDEIEFARVPRSGCPVRSGEFYRFFDFFRFFYILNMFLGDFYMEKTILKFS